MLITHDLGVSPQMCDRVAVLYAGRVVESGTRTRSARRARTTPTRRVDRGDARSAERRDSG